MKIKIRKFFIFFLSLVITFPVVTFLYTWPAEAQDINLYIISRSQWGADEGWRFDSSGQEIWPTEYAKVDKIIIHHTAGSLGGAEPAAVIRGIYHWQTVSLGWGDVGYHYLIDEKGNIYEGRYGGDGVIGAHAYNDKRNVGYNRGTLGIAILGNYENDVLTDAAKEALTSLIAVKARDFSFAPNDRSIFNSEDLPNVIGHRDIDFTLCPGKNIYSQMDSLRQDAQIKYQGLPGLPVSDKIMTYVGQSETTLTLQPGEEKEIWADYRNDGSSTWKSYVASTPYLSVAENSKLKASDWLSDTQVAGLASPNVEPSGTGRFVFKVKAPTDEIRTDQTFMIKWDEEILPNTSFSLHLEITGFDYAANDFQADILPATFPRNLKTVNLTYKNIGLKNWARDDIYLAITNDDGSKSPYYHSSWPETLGKIRFNENEVASQGTATFTFRMSSPSVSQYRTYFQLKKSDGEVLPGSLHSVATRVDSTYQARVIEHNIPAAVLNNWRFPAVIKIKNVGLTTWDKNVVLNVYDGDGRNSVFSHQTWPAFLGHFTFAESRVKPGQTATFKLTLYPPATLGTYYTIFKLEYKSRPDIIIQGDFPRLIRVDDSGIKVDPGFQAQFVSVKSPPAMLAGKKATAEVKMKNTGTKTWGREIVLNIYDADYRETYFRDSTWLAFEGGIHFRETQVKPGQTATFRFVLRAPAKTGLYRNRFRLALEGREFLSIPGSEDSALTRVDPK